MSEETNEMSEREGRIRAITRFYYSQPKIQEILLSFGINREVVPRYFEGFGKRPDTLQYPSDIMGLVNKGATSFHASEEIWRDPLAINADMSTGDLTALRISWDLLIDIDSRFLDCSRVAAEVICEFLESQGITAYGIKFSGSRGFHLIIPGETFPEEYDGEKRAASFPAWPRAVCAFIMHHIRRAYNAKVMPIMPSIEVIEQRTQKKKEDFLQAVCPDCGRPSEKGISITYACENCKFTITRKDVKHNKRELKCSECTGSLHVAQRENYFYCPHCKTSSFSAVTPQGAHTVTYTKEARERAKTISNDFNEEIAGEALGRLDLVLVAPRHLFRMPYSLHEKSALASVVLTKQEIATFTPRDANPLKIVIRPYIPAVISGSGRRLLSMALEWKKEHDTQEATHSQKSYSGKKFEETELKGVSEAMFPSAIKKLLKGMQDGKKRGLFILITFLRSCGFSPEYINTSVHEWNKKNDPPLKEGYLKGQLDWHLRQKKKILPPNYDNVAFYKDLGLISGKQAVKNPLVEVGRALRKTRHT